MSVMMANEALERVVAMQLPSFNAAYLNGDMTLEELVDLVSLPVNRLIRAVLDGGVAGMGSDERKRVMMTLGFITGTVERHAQTEGRPINAGIKFFPDYERMLVALAGKDLPARDTATTLWLTNRLVHHDKLLTYTADRGERFFNRQVCELDDALTLANEVLRGIVGTGGALGGVDAADRLAALPGLAHRYKGAYSDFRRRDDEGLPITPEFFTFVFRTFLPAIEIDGETWNGPNAAWLPSVFSFDSLFGTATGWYRDYNRDKVKYLTAAETATVTADLSGPSVMDVLAATVRTPAGLASVPTADLAARLNRAGPHVVRAARAVRDTWLELTKGTRGHELLVRDFLDKPSADLDDAATARMAVKPAEGTGGGSRDLLADIGEMRKACISANALRNALRLLDGDTGPGVGVAA